MFMINMMLVFLAALLPISSAKALDVAKKSVSLNLNDEPKELDPQKASDAIAGMIIGHTYDGLFRLDARDKPVAAVAESWDAKSPTQYTFKLKKNVLWSDGKPVTAKDFEYAWRRAVDPKVASTYAFIMFTVKNAKAINEGKMPIEKLGVTAVDDYTLNVELERPCAYFLRLLAFSTYVPARKDVVEKFGEKYGSDAEKMVYNGAFIIADWKHDASMRLVKNEKYWNKDKIQLNEINMPYLIRDLNSEFNMFKDGKYDLMWRISKELLPDAQKNRMQILKYTDGSVWYLEMNTARQVTANKNIRKAIQYAIDRTEYVNQVYGIPGTKPAYSIIPEYMPGAVKKYGEEYPISFKDGDIAKAKKYLEAGLKELKMTTLPPIAILGSDTDEQKRDLEYMQRYLKEKLGIDIKIDLQTFKVRLERMDKKDFDIVWAGWGPDYLDPMTFADLFTSWNGNNHTSWAAPGQADYDKFIDQAMNATDVRTRLKAMNSAEKVLVEDAPIVPLYLRYRVYVQNPKLVGVLRRAVGPDPDFYYARIADAVSKK